MTNKTTQELEKDNEKLQDINNGLKQMLDDDKEEIEKLKAEKYSYERKANIYKDGLNMFKKIIGKLYWKKD